MIEERIRIAGLDGLAEILLDRWGVPHIRAGSLDDLFLAQGFNAARDRLWALDLWRKRGLGLLAADFGPGYLAQDRACRLFLYRGDMATEWAAYAPDAEAICTAFVRGINAYVALTEREPSLLPPEFARLGTRPACWAAGDVVRIRSHALARNLVSETLRTNVLARADLATDLLRQDLQPPVEPSGDPAAVPLAVLDDYRLATAPVTFSPERLSASLAGAGAWRRVDDLGEVVRDAAFEGSNNWAIGPSRTATGRAILASDPHRAHALPSLRYLAHLTAPGLDVIGAGEPAVPGLSIGHNGRIAFGLTIFYADQEDLYVYDTCSGPPDTYRYGQGFEAMRIVEERVEVKGCEAQRVLLKFTRHGPVLHETPGRAYAVRSVWFEPGAAPYLKSLASMRSADLPAFRAHMQGWGTPSVNHVCADTQGNIAWIPAGFTPVRPGWDGLLPVPGDGSREWAGLLDAERLPRSVNPACGFVATANEMNLPADYPHEAQRVGHEWVEGSRAARIREALAASGLQDVAASCALQTDTLSMPARRLGRLLADLYAGEPDAARGLVLLGGWDHRLEWDSAPAALFEVWWTHHLKPALLARLAPEAVRALLLPGDVESLLRVLETPDTRLGGPEARDALLLETLAAAVRDCAARMGAGPHAWAWGRLHQALFEHPLSGLGPQPELPGIGPFAMGGSASTPMHTGYRPSDFRVVAGASVRIVVDVGDWDRSVWINAPGQSGDPRSAHYGNLAPVWARGRYVPMLYTREAVDAAAVRRIVLEPGEESR